MKNRIIFTALIFFEALRLQAQEIDYKGFPEWSWHKHDSTEYYLYTPSKRKQSDLFPVVLALHGCCGDNYKATLRNTVDPIVRMWHHFGENRQDVPTYIIAPKTKRGWMQHAENLKAVIDDLIENHSADPARVYITGFSMGADGTWKMLEKYPDLFAAAIPMGMKYTGAEPDRIRHIPIWTIRGGEDWWARYLGQHVAEFRRRNNAAPDSGTFITGVNPRFTSFEKMGHGIMWQAASTQDILSWTYSKIKDGNRYPTVYFTSPENADTLNLAPNSELRLHVKAFDEDGTIAHVSFFHNERLIGKFFSEPYNINWNVAPGVSQIRAVAHDDKGKTAEATLVLATNESVVFTTQKLEAGTCARHYHHSISAKGNAPVTFSVVSGALPEGISLSRNGSLNGFPTRAGKYTFTVRATDRDGDMDEHKFALSIGRKQSGDVLITAVKDYEGRQLPLSIATEGALPFYDRPDGEICLSQIPAKLQGLPVIQTVFNDTTQAGPHYLSFHVDVPVTVYVAYERKDHLYTSSVPSWLTDFEKTTNGQIVAQYFYYDIFAKDFPPGLVTLPDANEKANGVSTNYFVLIEAKKPEARRK